MKKEKLIMAKNWTLTQATEVFANNEKANIADIGKRFPIPAALIARSLSGDGEAVRELLGYMPEKVTMNIVNTAAKDGVGEPDSGEADSEPAAKEVKKAEAKTGGKYDGKTAKELYTECKERGIKVEPKLEAAVYVKALEKDDAKKAPKAEEKKAAASKGEYADKSPRELYKECKARGIEAEERKNAAYYAELLEKDDATAGGGDDGWDSEGDGESSEEEEDWNV